MAMCVTPFYARTNDGLEVPVPCGKCPPCLKRRASFWSFRLLKESERSSSAWFVTLTYSEKNVPLTDRGFMSLDVPSFQRFMKRLRKKHDKNVRLKYYCAGEYGTKTWRPHWHMILFNADIGKVDEAWHLGRIHCGDVSGASIGYTLKYMMKPPRVPVHGNDDRVKERSLMSKGLGSNYLTDSVVAWHRRAVLENCYIRLPGGVTMALPRYFKERLYSDAEREEISAHVCRENAERLDRYIERRKKESGENWFKIDAARVAAATERMYKNSLCNRDKI